MLPIQQTRIQLQTHLVVSGMVLHSTHRQQRKGKWRGLQVDTSYEPVLSDIADFGDQ